MIYLGNSPVGVAVSGGTDAAAIIEQSISGAYENSLATKVGIGALRNNANMTRLSLPNCTYFDDSAIRNCTSLTSVYLPKGENFGGGKNYILAGCTSLVTVALPSIKGTGSLPFGFQNDTALATVDLGDNEGGITNQTFSGCTSLKTLILRCSTAVWALGSTNVFNSSPFASGGTGGTIYIPKALYDHLGDGTSMDYKAASNWSTIDGYGTITWAKIEGSQYENMYADGTPVT